MIYLWVSFNAWLMYAVNDSVSKGNELTDAFLVEAAEHDKILKDKFEKLKKENSDFIKIVNEFSCLWPVFQAKELFRRNIDGWRLYQSDETRKDFIKRCLSAGISPKYYSHRCYFEHNEKPSADWPHTISAIYQVRCNLFHGGKNFINSDDANFVRHAFLILWHVWGKDMLQNYRPSLKRHNITN